MFNASFHRPSNVAIERAEKEPCVSSLSPWDALTRIYEVCEHHLTINPPQSLGYAFSHKYIPDNAAKSDIALAISYDWKAKTPGKYPAVFVFRDDAIIESSKTIGQMIGINVAESIEQRIALIKMNVRLVIIAQGIGFAEGFADYMKYPFMYFAKEIERDYCIHKLRFLELSKPTLYQQQGSSQDLYTVELVMNLEFYNQWAIKGDDLKLKTFSAEIYTSESETPLKNQ